MKLRKLFVAVLALCVAAQEEETVNYEQVALDKIAENIESDGCVAPQLPNTQSQNCGSFSAGLDDNKLHVDYLFAGNFLFVLSCSCMGLIDVSLTTLPSEIGYLTSLTMVHKRSALENTCSLPSYAWFTPIQELPTEFYSLTELSNL